MVTVVIILCDSCTQTLVSNHLNICNLSRENYSNVNPYWRWPKAQQGLVAGSCQLHTEIRSAISQLSTAREGEFGRSRRHAWGGWFCSVEMKWQIRISRKGMGFLCENNLKMFLQHHSQGKLSLRNDMPYCHKSIVHVLHLFLVRASLSVNLIWKVFAYPTGL